MQIESFGGWSRSALALAAALGVLSGCSDKSDQQIVSKMASLAGKAGAGRTFAKMKDGTEYVDGMLVVRYRDDVSPLAMNAINQRVGAETVHAYRFIPGLQAVQLPPGIDLDSAIAAFEKDPNVLYAERNVVFRASAVPNDPQFSQLWGMSQPSDV